MGSWSSSVDSARAEARDDYRTAAILGALVLVWGTLRLSRGPEPLIAPMEVGYLFQMSLAAAGLLFLGRTWHRPVSRLALGFAAVQTALWIVLVSFSCWSAARTGHIQDASISVQIALLAIPLIVPRGLVLGLTLVGLFAGGAIAIAMQSAALGLPRTVPVEPYVTLIFALSAGVQLVLRDRQRQMAHTYGVLAAEEAALEQLGPRLAAAGADLGTQLRRLSNAIHRLDGARSGTPVTRALDRLNAVNTRMDSLAREASIAAPVSADIWEQRVRAHHRHMSACAFAIFALLAAALAGTSWSERPFESGVMAGSIGISACAVLIYLASTRKQPSERGAVTASTILFFVALAGVTFVHWSFSRLGPLHRPFEPFLGHKLLTASVGTIGPACRRRVTALTTIAVADALFFYFVGFNPPVRVAAIEPWATLLAAALGLGYVHLREQRRRTAARLLHAEAAIRSLRRRAMTFFAVRDQLNSPLQTLILGLARIEATCTQDEPERLDEVRAAIGGLMDLANDLARLQDDLPSESPASLDAAEELRPRLAALRESTAR